MCCAQDVGHVSRIAIDDTERNMEQFTNMSTGDSLSNPILQFTSFAAPIPAFKARAEGSYVDFQTSSETLDMHKSLKRYDMSQWIDAFCDRTPKRVQEMIAAPLPPTLETIKSLPLADAKDNGVYCHVAWDADGRIIWIYVRATFGQAPNAKRRYAETDQCSPQTRQHRRLLLRDIGSFSLGEVMHSGPVPEQFSASSLERLYYSPPERLTINTTYAAWEATSTCLALTGPSLLLSTTCISYESICYPYLSIHMRISYTSHLNAYNAYYAPLIHTTSYIVTYSLHFSSSMSSTSFSSTSSTSSSSFASASASA